MRFRDFDEFGPTLDIVAESLDISATAIEKDYWVSEVLRTLVATFPDDFIFKGGTSLSKAYGIIERFSEDIDVLVLPGERGRGAVDKLMKAMGDAAATGVGGEASGAGAEMEPPPRPHEVARDVPAPLAVVVAGVDRRVHLQVARSFAEKTWPG